jgi:hypothetical protein
MRKTWPMINWTDRQYCGCLLYYCCTCSLPGHQLKSLCIFFLETHNLSKVGQLSRLHTDTCIFSVDGHAFIISFFYKYLHIFNTSDSTKDLAIPVNKFFFHFNLKKCFAIQASKLWNIEIYFFFMFLFPTICILLLLLLSSTHSRMKYQKSETTPNATVASNGLHCCYIQVIQVFNLPPISE